MAGKCKFKDAFDFCVVSKDIAEYILDRIGFGQQKCVETNQYDGRYGYWDDNDHALKYGFRDMHGAVSCGKYVVFGSHSEISLDVYTREEFDEYFDVIERTL